MTYSTLIPFEIVHKISKMIDSQRSRTTLYEMEVTHLTTSPQFRNSKTLNSMFHCISGINIKQSVKPSRTPKNYSTSFFLSSGEMFLSHLS
jgi:hypothetical protein